MLFLYLMKGDNFSDLLFASVEGYGLCIINSLQFSVDISQTLQTSKEHIISKMYMRVFDSTRISFDRIAAS